MFRLSSILRTFNWFRQKHLEKLEWIELNLLAGLNMDGMINTWHISQWYKRRAFIKYIFFEMTCFLGSQMSEWFVSIAVGKIFDLKHSRTTRNTRNKPIFVHFWTYFHWFVGGNVSLKAIWKFWYHIRDRKDQLFS